MLAEAAKVVAKAEIVLVLLSEGRITIIRGDCCQCNLTANLRRESCRAAYPKLLALP